MGKSQNNIRGKKKVQRKKVPSRSGDVLVTQRMLSETKSELKSDITSVWLEVRALDKKVDSLEQKMESRFKQVDARFSQMDSKISHLDSKIETVIAAVHRTNALVEEQNSRNRAVLDGYDQIYRRQEEYERRLKNLEGI